jgi:hypothetical protein
MKFLVPQKSKKYQLVWFFKFATGSAKGRLIATPSGIWKILKKISS